MSNLLYTTPQLSECCFNSITNL